MNVAGAESLWLPQLVCTFFHTVNNNVIFQFVLYGLMTVKVRLAASEWIGSDNQMWWRRLQGCTKAADFESAGIFGRRWTKELGYKRCHALHFRQGVKWQPHCDPFIWQIIGIGNLYDDPRGAICFTTSCTSNKDTTTRKEPQRSALNHLILFF